MRVADYCATRTVPQAPGQAVAQGARPGGVGGEAAGATQSPRPGLGGAADSRLVAQPAGPPPRRRRGGADAAAAAARLTGSSTA